MKDFLSQLIARSTAPALAVRPRLPSRFEASAQPAGIPALPGDSTPAAPLETTVGPTRTLRTSPPSDISAQVPSAPAEPDEASTSPSAQTTPPPPQNHAPARATASATVSPAAPAAHSSKLATPVSPALAPANTPATATVRQSPTAKPLPAKALLQPSFDSGIQSPEPPAPGSVSEAASSTIATSAASPEPVSPKPTASSKPSPPASGLRPESEIANLSSQTFAPPARPALAVRPASVPAPSAAAAPAQPVVEITIGRVELRAIVTPASPRAVPPTAPKLGLDEYLRQRTGGAR